MRIVCSPLAQAIHKHPRKPANNHNARLNIRYSLLVITLVCLFLINNLTTTTAFPVANSTERIHSSIQQLNVPSRFNHATAHVKPLDNVNSRVSIASIKSSWEKFRRSGILFPRLRYDKSTQKTAMQGMRTLTKRKISTTHAVEAAMIPVLILLSGLFAGLTLAYFSIDPTQLQVLSISGTPVQQERAKRIIPVRKNGHLLLTTLLLANMIVNEALPVVADGPLGSGIVSVVISTVLVVIFAEIIPQSVCSRYGLNVGAKMATFTRVFMYIFMPLAYPVAKLLEFFLGKHHGIVYRRRELRELIKFHAKGGEGGGDLEEDTVTLAQGALGLQDMTVKDAMTPIEETFMLNMDSKLDYETLGRIVATGHSRIPVYTEIEVPDISAGLSGKTRIIKKIHGALLVKSCVMLDPEDATPLSQVKVHPIPTVKWDQPLTGILKVFSESRSHMAIVSRRGAFNPPDDGDAESVMTEAAWGMRKRLFKKITEKVRGGDSDSDSSDDEKATAKKEKPTSSGGRIIEAAKLQPQEQALPADAQLPKDNLERFVEGIAGDPFGIVTFQDVMVNLLGQEIADETTPLEVIGLAAGYQLPRRSGSAPTRGTPSRSLTSTPRLNGGTTKSPPGLKATVPIKSATMPLATNTNTINLGPVVHENHIGSDRTRPNSPQRPIETLTEEPEQLSHSNSMTSTGPLEPKPISAVDSQKMDNNLLSRSHE